MKWSNGGCSLESGRSCIPAALCFRAPVSLHGSAPVLHTVYCTLGLLYSPRPSSGTTHLCALPSGTAVLGGSPLLYSSAILSYCRGIALRYRPLRSVVLPTAQCGTAALPGLKPGVRAYRSMLL